MARTTENSGRGQGRMAGRGGRSGSASRGAGSRGASATGRGASSTRRASSGGQSGRRMWDEREMKALRDGAGSSRGAGAIATQLGRTEAAIRNKASKEGIYFTADRGGRGGSRSSGRSGTGGRKAASRRGGTRSRLH
jgi:hypothetical protein